MKRALKLTVASILAGLMMPLAVMAQAPAPAAAAGEDARLTAFLDAEFAQFVKMNPQLATRLGIKDGGDRWNDIGDAAAAAQVAWRKDSAARMKAQFDRARLSPEAQVNFDIWALEADRAAMAYAIRQYRRPLYSRLYPRPQRVAGLPDQHP